jgi:hypothetical protein
MFQGHGRVLERRVKVRLRQVPCVTRFRKKAKIGEFEPLDHLRFFLKRGPVSPFSDGGMDKYEDKENKTESYIDHEKVRFSHRG